MPLEGCVIDLVRRGTLIEIQTGSFAKLARKLTRLVRGHRVRLVHPIARRKWIVTTAPDGNVLRRRASPKRGAYRDLFAELVRIPHLVGQSQLHPRSADRRGGGTALCGRARQLAAPRRQHRRHPAAGSVRAAPASASPADFARLLPPHLEEPFTNRTLAAAGAMPASLAGMMTYTLRRIGAIELVGRRNRAYLFART